MEDIFSCGPTPASLHSLNPPEEHSSSPAPAFTGVSWGAFLKPCPSPRRAPWGHIPAALSLPLALCLPPFSPLAPFPQALAFLCSPALGRSIAPIASGTRGNPYPRAPLAHCSGRGLSARKGVIPLPDRGRQWPPLIWVTCNISLPLLPSLPLSTRRGRHNAGVYLVFVNLSV